MSILTYSVSIPLWLLIIMLLAIIPGLVLVGKRFFRGKQEDEGGEQRQRDTILWKLQNRVRTAQPSRGTSREREEDKAEQEQKAQLVNILKILLKEGEKGVLMKAAADRMGTSILNAQHAMNKLIEKNLVEEVVSVSGTKYYLTQKGKEYCLRKTGKR